MSFLDRLLSRLEQKTINRTSDYFYDAIRVYLRNYDPIVLMAARAAGQAVARDERASMVSFLRELEPDLPDDKARLLSQLADELSFKDWTIRDAVDGRAALAELDAEYALALKKFDSTIFRRRFPEFFD
jgi:hypothetical protein